VREKQCSVIQELYCSFHRAWLIFCVREVCGEVAWPDYQDWRWQPDNSGGHGKTPLSPGQNIRLPGLLGLQQRLHTDADKAPRRIRPIQTTTNNTHDIDLKKVSIKNASSKDFATAIEKIPYRGYEVEDISDGRKIVIVKPGGKLSIILLVRGVRCLGKDGKKGMKNWLRQEQGWKICW